MPEERRAAQLPQNSICSRLHSQPSLPEMSSQNLQILREGREKNKETTEHIYNTCQQKQEEPRTFASEPYHKIITLATSLRHTPQDDHHKTKA